MCGNARSGRRCQCQDCLYAARSRRVYRYLYRHGSAGTGVCYALQSLWSRQEADLATRHRTLMRRTVPADVLIRVRDALATVCVYSGLYIGLDWLSFVHVLSTTGFTLWNPPPACSLALLLIK